MFIYRNNKGVVGIILSLPSPFFNPHCYSTLAPAFIGLAFANIHNVCFFANKLHNK
jgi:hypothetical protein